MNKGTKGIRVAERLAARPWPQARQDSSAGRPGKSSAHFSRLRLPRGRGLRVTGVAEAGERPFRATDVSALLRFSPRTAPRVWAGSDGGKRGGNLKNYYC